MAKENLLLRFNVKSKVIQGHCGQNFKLCSLAIRLGRKTRNQAHDSNDSNTGRRLSKVKIITYSNYLLWFTTLIESQESLILTFILTMIYSRPRIEFPYGQTLHSGFVQMHRNGLVFVKQRKISHVSFCNPTT